MKLEQRQSGLIVPRAKPAPQRRRYGPLEIQDDEHREQARAALIDLWNAMQLTQWSQMRDQAQYEAHSQAWTNLAKMLLDDDVPNREVWC